MSVLYLTTATLNVPPVTPTGHNGSRIQGTPGNGDFIFVDHFKNGQGWSGGAGGWVDPLTLDANGWPNTLPITVTNKMYVPSQAERPGQYVVDWQGNGTLFIGGGHATLASGSLTSTTGSGSFRLSMDPNTNTFDIGIASLTTKITNIRVYHVDDIPIIDTEIFSPKVIEYAREFGVIRFMDSHFAVTGGEGNLTTWNMRKPLSYNIWASAERRGSITYVPTYALNGSSNDYAKTYTDGHGSAVAGPYDKETIILRFANSATNATVTFNKNGTGAVPVRHKSGAVLTSNQRPQTGNHGTYIYDAAFGAWMAWGGDFNGSNPYLLNGWPLEVFLELCKKAGAHPHITFCHTMFDPISDYPAECARFIKENYQDTDCPWMVPRFEPANELWNNQFTQTAYANAKQLLRNGGSSTALPVTAMTYTGTGTTGVTTITATGGSIYKVGSALFMGGTWTGLGQWSANTVYVTAINQGGPDTFKVNRAPSSGVYNGSGGTVNGQAFDYHTFYGRILSELGQAIAGVYGVTKANVKTQPYYELICCVQTASTPAAVNERVLATQYGIENGGDPAKDWTTMIGIAQYVSTDCRGKPKEVGMAWMYNQGDLTQGDLYADETMGTALATIPNLNTVLYPGWKTWATGHGIMRMCGYEGGYSVDYLMVGVTVFSTITGATIDATGCTLTVSNGSIDVGWVAAATNANGCFDANCVGMTFTIAGVVGMTQLNGLTATITSFTAPNQVKTNINSAAFTPYGSGGTATVVNGRVLINAVRYAGKKSPNLKDYMKTSWSNFLGHTGGGFTCTFPSGFIWTGSSCPVDLSLPQVPGGTTTNTQIWSVRDPDIYSDTDPQSLALEEFNDGV